MKNNRQSADGIALISVMVVVAVVAAAAAQLLYRQNIDIERSTRIMSREQAFLFAFGLETYARNLLSADRMEYDYYVDFGRHAEEDGLIEVWSWPIPNRHMGDRWLETLGRAGTGRLEARVHDLSGLFNLNGVRQAVVARGKDNKPGRWEVMYEQLFKNLVIASFDNDVDVPDADALWNALLDWFDNDNRVLPGGAEDEDYMNHDPPYLTGQGRMAWPEELRLIEGFNGKITERLLPLMSALPHIGQVRMNINTADEELLRHVPGLDAGIVGEIISRRADKVYFLNRNEVKPFLTNIGVENTPAEFFDVKSEFFLFSACIRFGQDRPIEMQSLLHRIIPQSEEEQRDTERDKVVVLQRRMGSGYYKGGECRADSSKTRSGETGDEPQDAFDGV